MKYLSKVSSLEVATSSCFLQNAAYRSAKFRKKRMLYILFSMLCASCGNSGISSESDSTTQLQNSENVAVNTASDSIIGVGYSGFSVAQAQEPTIAAAQVQSTLIAEVDTELNAPGQSVSSALQALGSEVDTGKPVSAPDANEAEKVELSPDAAKELTELEQELAALKPTTSLSILNQQVNDVSESEAAIYWQLNSPATGQLAYGTTTDLGQWSTPEDSYTYDVHTQKLSFLEPDTLYYYRIHSTDEYGAETVSDIATFQTKPVSQAMNEAISNPQVQPDSNSTAGPIASTNGDLPRGGFSDTEYGLQIVDQNCPGIPTEFNNIHWADSYQGFLDAYQSAGPGDAVIIRNGTYEWSVPKQGGVSSTERPLKLDRDGTAEAPIYVLPESLHGVTFKRNDFTWALLGKHNVFAGFRFTQLVGDTIKVNNSDNRVACNYFENASRYIQVKSQRTDRVELDNNEFNDSTGPAVMIKRCNPVLSGCLSNSKYAHVHHNLWRDKEYTGKNGHEAIILGLGYSPIPGVSIYNPEDGAEGSDMMALIENNMFDKWNGENELISIKASKNVIRNNCIKDSPKSGFKVRLGSDNLITGNWYENSNHGGQEISGKRNHIVFNYWSHNPQGSLRMASGSEYTDADGYLANLMVYIAASDNVISHNVFNGNERLVSVSKPFGSASSNPRRGVPEGNIIANNDIYSTNYRGNADSGGYYASSDYTESQFRAANNWQTLNLINDELPTSKCGNRSHFSGPGGTDALLPSSSNLMWPDQSIRAPSWW